MKEKLTKEEVGFAQVKNEVLCDKKISLKAKGMFAYLYSKPDDWDFSGHRIVNECSEGKRAVFAALGELEKAGYLSRNRQPDGRMEYRITWRKPDLRNEDKAQKPDLQNRNLLKPQLAKTATVSNKDIITNKEVVTNKEDTLEIKTKQFIQDVKECLNGIPLHKNQVTEIKKFVSYWTEPNRSKTKLRWEMEKTWDIKRRIGTWMRNSINFNKQQRKGVAVEI